jgi:hypothetical protein
VGADGTVRGWNLSTRHCDFVLQCGDENLFTAMVRGDGRLVAAISSDGRVHAWDIADDRQLAGLPPRSCKVGGVYQTDLPGKPDVGLALVNGCQWALGCRGNTATLWDLSTSQPLAAFTGDTVFESCGTSPDGSVAVVGTISGSTHTLGIEAG